MFQIVVIFALVSGLGHGEAYSDPYPSFEACEAARPETVEGFRKAIEAEHGPLNIESKCVPVGTPA